MYIYIYVYIFIYILVYSHTPKVICPYECIHLLPNPFPIVIENYLLYIYITAKDYIPLCNEILFENKIAINLLMVQCNGALQR